MALGVLLLLLVLVHLNPPASPTRIEACDVPRNPAPVSATSAPLAEEFQMKINLDIGLRTGPICMIKGGYSCEPLNYNSNLNDTQHWILMKYLQETFPESNLSFQVIDIENMIVHVMAYSKRPGHVRKKAEWAKTFEEVKWEFKSLFCESGVCQNGTSEAFPDCAPGTRDLSKVTIPFHEVNSKFIKLQKDVALFIEMWRDCPAKMK
jgi:hypothetical protein